jgi:hypothetical protein
VANRNKGRRGRPRKRRPAAASAAQGPASSPAAAPPASAPKASRSRAGAPRPGNVLTDRLAVGERPRAPWHPLPLSELLILIGAIGTVVGVSRGASGLPVTVAGLAAVLIGTVEVTVREHLSGYRSQTLILTLLPTVLPYTALVLVVRPSGAVSLVLLALDAAAGVFLFKRLRARFLRARRERTFAAKR